MTDTEATEKYLTHSTLETNYLAPKQEAIVIRNDGGLIDSYVLRGDLPRGAIGDEMWVRLTTGLTRKDGAW